MSRCIDLESLDRNIIAYNDARKKESFPVVSIISRVEIHINRFKGCLKFDTSKEQ